MPVFQGINIDTTVLFNYSDSTGVGYVEDSLYNYPDTIKSAGSESFFQVHELAVDDLVPHELVRPNNGWILPILLFCTVLIAIIQLIYRKKFLQIVQASWSNQYANQLVREGSLASDWITLGLGIITLLISSLFIYQVNIQILELPSPGNTTNLQFYLIIFACYSIYLIFKLLLIGISELIFLTRKVTNKYLLNSLIFNINIAILLLPVLIVSTYTKSAILLKITLVFIGIILIYKLFRAIMVGLTNTKFSIVYLFLYLCTVEILPVLLVLKLTMNYYNISW